MHEIITLTEAKRRGLTPITEYSPPNEKIKTRHGVMSYIEWLRIERERMSHSNRKVEIVEYFGLVSLYANPIPLTLGS